MGNQEWTIQRHWQHLGTQDTGRRQIKQKTQHRKLKRWATRTTPKNEGELRCSWRVKFHLLMS